MLLLKLLSDSSINKERVSTSSFTSSLFIQELLDGWSSTCYELMRMEKHGFISLCHMFREKGWLVDSKHLKVEEKMTMFLMTISHNLRNWLTFDLVLIVLGHLIKGQWAFEKKEERTKCFICLETQARSEGYMTKVFKTRCPKPLLVGSHRPQCSLQGWIGGFNIL